MLGSKEFVGTFVGASPCRLCRFNFGSLAQVLILAIYLLSWSQNVASGEAGSNLTGAAERYI